MAHISLSNNLPGITGLMAYRPETAGPLNELAEILLRGPNSLTPGERELIATYVSRGNDCKFCMSIHRGAAKAHLKWADADLDLSLRNPGGAPLSPKMKALLNIAGKVRELGLRVTADDISAAKAAGASDVELHDTVLIAAAFCMYNRYVDGLGTWAPDDPAHYERAGERLAREGYLDKR